MAFARPPFPGCVTLSQAPDYLGPPVLVHGVDRTAAMAGEAQLGAGGL